MARKKPVDLDALLEAARTRAREDSCFYLEAIWKDAAGAHIQLAEVHRLIVGALDRAWAARIPILIAAPRGIGKSEIGMGYLTKIIDQNPTLRCSIVTDMTDHSAERVSAVARYIDADEDHARLFPDVKIGRNKRTRFAFRVNQNKYAKDATLQGGGIMSSGVGNRSDVIFFDDVVTERNAVLQPADIPRVKGSFKGTWLPTLEPNIGWWYYICTFYAANDLSHDLMENKSVAHLHISVSENFDCFDVREYWPGDAKEKTYTVPLWEEKWNEAAYRARYDLLVSGGEALKWYTGYRNMVIDPKTAKFRKTPGFVRTVLRPEWDGWRHIVMYADPASSQEEKADFYAGVVLGWDPRRRAAIVLHKWKVKEPLGERVRRYLDVWQAFTPHADGVEGKHELSFREELRRTAAEVGLPIQARPVNHGPEAEKIARIASIAPLIETGKILFDGSEHPEFWDEAQLFPRGRNDDLLDALEGAWVLLRKRLWRNRQIPGTFDPDAPFEDRNSGARLAKYRVPLRDPGNPYVSRDKSARNLLWE